MEFLKNFLVGFVISACIVSVALGCMFMFIVGIYWISGGTAWGLAFAVVSIPSLILALLFAIEESWP